MVTPADHLHVAIVGHVGDGFVVAEESAGGITDVSFPIGGDFQVADDSGVGITNDDGLHVVVSCVVLLLQNNKVFLLPWRRWQRISVVDFVHQDCVEAIPDAGTQMGCCGLWRLETSTPRELRAKPQMDAQPEATPMPPLLTASRR